MGKMVGFWGVICVSLVLSKWGAQSFEVDGFLGKNRSDASILESMSFLDSVHGVSAAAVPLNALMVGLTLVQGAAAKGAGTNLSFSLSLSPEIDLSSLFNGFRFCLNSGILLFIIFVARLE